jgi:DNA-binding Lrp family transcriptional regulator
MTQSPQTLDRIDLKILACLESDGRTSQPETG